MESKNKDAVLLTDWRYRHLSQNVKSLTAKLNDLSSIPRTYKAEGGYRIPQVVL